MENLAYIAYLERLNAAQRDEISNLFQVQDELRGYLDDAEANAHNAEQKLFALEELGKDGTGRYVRPEHLPLILQQFVTGATPVSVINQIRLVRIISGLGLKDAKDLVDQFMAKKSNGG